MTETHRKVPECLETAYGDSDLKRAHDLEQPTDENT